MPTDNTNYRRLNKTCNTVAYYKYNPRDFLSSRQTLSQDSGSSVALISVDGQHNPSSTSHRAYYKCLLCPSWNDRPTARVITIVSVTRPRLWPISEINVIETFRSLLPSVFRFVQVPPPPPYATLRQPAA